MHHPFSVAMVLVLFLDVLPLFTAVIFRHLTWEFRVIELFSGPGKLSPPCELNTPPHSLLYLIPFIIVDFNKENVRALLLVPPFCR